MDFQNVFYDLFGRIAFKCTGYTEQHINLVRRQEDVAIMHNIESLFGADADRFIGMIDELALAKTKARYSFVVNDDYNRLCQEDLGRGMQIYWNEILARAHLTAIVAILRSRHWINAVDAARVGKNLLSFASAFRGLIESAADTSSALGSIPGTLVRDSALISRALSGQSENQIVISNEIEDGLIHFSYARHLTKTERTTVPPSHEAKKVRDYIEVLEKGQVHQVIACYQSLCDLTHPGASSVWMWLTSENGTDIELQAGQDESIIADYLENYRETFLQLLMFAFNPALVTLNVLNYFPLRALHTSKLLKWDLSSIPLWQICRSTLTGATPFARAALQSVKPGHGM